MQNFHNLRAWCLADELADSVVDTFPLRGSRRVTGLRGQAIRSAQSIPANLAEGCGRSGRGEFIAFIDVALGSATELENHLGAALKARTIPTDVHKRLQGKLITLGKMLRALRDAVERADAEEKKSRRRNANAPRKRSKETPSVNARRKRRP